MGRTGAPIHVIVYDPKTETGRQELAERAAHVHADMIIESVKKLNCPSDRKVQLLDAVIKSASIKKAGEQTP